jgi:hypothetical protein
MSETMSKINCRECAFWFMEWPGDEIGLCQNQRSKNYGFAPGPNETCSKAERDIHMKTNSTVIAAPYPDATAGIHKKAMEAAHKAVITPDALTSLTTLAHFCNSLTEIDAMSRVLHNAYYCKVTGKSMKNYV